MEMRFFAVAALVAVLASAVSFANQPAAQKPLDQSVYDSWKSVRGQSLSRDGNWLIAPIVPQEGDSNVLIKNLNTGQTITLARGSGVRFSKDSNFAIGLVVPPFADVKAAKRKKTKPEDMPKNSLAIVNLKTAQVTTVEKVVSFMLPEEDSGWIAYKLEPPKEEAPAKPADKPKATDAKEAPKPKEKKPGQPLVIRNLLTGKEETIPFVAQAAFAKNGTALIYATLTKDGKGDGVTLDDLQHNLKTPIATSKGDYPQLAIDHAGDMVAYEYKQDPPEPKKDAPEDAPAQPPVLAEVYFFKAGAKKPERVGLDSMPKGWAINEKTAIRFSDQATRLVYATYPAPPPPAKEVPDDEKVSVDIWTWQDSKLMPMQLLEAEAERNKGYMAVFDVAKGKSMQIANREMPTIELSDKGDGRFALGETSVPYDRQTSWGLDYSDWTLIDLQSNSRWPIAYHSVERVELSPKGNCVVRYDDDAKTWIALDCPTRKNVAFTVGLPIPLTNELSDVPAPASPYGIVGWFSETKPVVADRFDLWACDTTGKAAPHRLTDGRDLAMQFRPIQLDPDADYLPADGVLLSAFNEDTKQAGIYRLDGSATKRVMMEDKAIGGYQKAKNADRLIFTQQDFTECPDVWATNLAFENPVKETDANPQQKDYLWGTAELVRWTSLDGVPLSGILVKPANFDYGKKYPMITYFYERLSDSLHDYHSPGPSASVVNPSYLASNGYCVFIPDIPYKVGYPGYSSLSAILPGVQSIVSRGYVDPKKLGIEGMSWGGYEVAYLVTQTNMFAAAEAGAPVGDMFSAYGGIRYGSGVVREFQYEHGQSRIGGTPWDSTLRYLENSPVFFADKIQTPLMIMSNDKDGTVPHTQGIEFFTALRRLNKPSWMVVYNGEDHNIVERKNRKDFDVRLYQFFDHYLKGAPMPEWMAKGVPGVDKGRNYGLGLVP